jgi:hypothetical protein
MGLFEERIAESASPALLEQLGQTIVYTASGGAGAVSVSAIVTHQEKMRDYDEDDGETLRATADVVIRDDALASPPRQGDKVTIGPDTYRVTNEPPSETGFYTLTVEKLEQGTWGATRRRSLARGATRGRRQ